MDIEYIAQAFRAHNKSFYLVGGTIRDAILKRPSHDTDATTNARPEEIKYILSTTNPDNLYTVGEKFGTIGAMYDSEIVEVTTYRTERYIGGSRKPDVIFGESLEEDLARRDFTMNAIAYDPLTGEYVDPYGGREDIRYGLLRAVGNAKDRFKEDPLRMLRAIRFSCQLDFLLEDMDQALTDGAYLLQTISKERIREEFSKILVCAYPSRGIRELVRHNHLLYFLKEWYALIGVEQFPHHFFDVADHTCLVVDGVQKSLALRLAALLHDIAKPITKTVDDQGHCHFLKHEDVGAEMARDILTRLKLDGTTITHVCKIISLHMRINQYSPSWSDGAVRRFMVDAGECLEDLFSLAFSDGSSDTGKSEKEVRTILDHFRSRIEKLSIVGNTFVSPLSGYEIMQMFELAPGPKIKEIKNYLMQLVLDGDLGIDEKENAYQKVSLFLHVQERD